MTINDNEKEYLTWCDILEEEGIYEPLNCTEKLVVTHSFDKKPTVLWVTDKQICKADTDSYREMRFQKSNLKMFVSFK